MEYSLYIVRCSDNSLYTGIAKDLDARIKKHNLGQGAKALRGRLPVELVYKEHYPDRSTAQQREAAIKKLSKAEKEALVGG